MARQTKDQKIAALEAHVKNLELIATESLRERDDARASLAAVTIGAKGDDLQRLRLAALAFPQDTPSSIGWDDLAQYFGQHEADDAQHLKRARTAAAEHEIPHAASMRLDALLDAMAEALEDARAERAELNEIHEVDGWREWIIFARENPDLDPETVERAMGIFDALDLGATQRMRVLASADMAYALRQELARQ